MCGRYARRYDKQRIAKHFHLHGPSPPDFGPSWNVAPQTFQPIVRLNRDTGERELVLMRWGLIPFSFWAKDPSIGLRTINAKAETITTAPAFREEIKYRRCLVPSDLFYEWVRPESRPDDCPASSRDRTCRPIGSTLGGQAVRQRTVEKPSDNVTAAARLLSKP
jgi:putative SOS response-associated peptidase YedK